MDQRESNSVEGINNSVGDMDMSDHNGIIDRLPFFNQEHQESEILCKI